MYNGVPNFNDSYAKIQERTHSSGAKVIDILYGAKDEHGNSTYPKRNSDGHGHFIGIEIEGLYQAIYWRHSASEGGGYEYGVSRSDNPLADLERDIDEKKQIIDEVWNIMRHENYDVDKVEGLFARYNALYDMHTPVEQRLNKRYSDAVRYNRKNRERLIENKRRIEQKQLLITKARDLKDSSEFKNTSVRMKELMDEWKEIGYSGDKNTEDALWKEFNSARQFFYDRRSTFYKERENKRITNYSEKEQIIFEARTIASDSTDWAGTHRRLQALFERWKGVGSAGKEDDERLWSEFQSVRNGFYDRRNAARKLREQEYEANRQEKSRLITEACGYASSRDYSESVSQYMKELNSQWKEIGSAGGKDVNDALWRQFRDAQDSFWEGKSRDWERRRQEKEEKHQEWLNKARDAISRKQGAIDKKRANIYNLQERLYTTNNYNKQAQIEQWIAEDEADIREIEDDIRRIENDIYGG